MKKQDSLGKFYLVEGIPIFRNLQPEEIESVAEKIQILDLKKGDFVFEEGKGNPYFYAIATGMVEVYKSKKDKSFEILEILRKGDYFGLISLLTNQPHSSTAKCLEDTRLLRMNAKDFRKVLQDIPNLGMAFARILSLILRKEILGEKDDIRNTIFAYWGDQTNPDDFLDQILEQTEILSGKKPVLLKFQKGKKESNHPYEKVYQIISKPKIREILERYMANFDFLFLDVSDSLPEVRRLLLSMTDILYYKKEVLLKSDIQKLIDEYPAIEINAIESIQPETIKSISRKVTGRRVGIALGGGAALGLSQIGILKVCQEEGLEFDMISGTSIGAVIGAYWAAGISWDVLLEVIAEFDSVFKFFRFIDFSFHKGLFSGRNIRSLLEKHLSGLQFSDLKIPLKLIACDIITRTEVELSSGNLVDAIMASVAIPGVFSPIHLADGRVLVDGGIVNPLPVSSLTKEGINRIVAVNSMPSSKIEVKSNDKNPSIIDIIVNSLYSLQYRIGKYSAQEADVYLNPILENSSWFEFYRGREFMEFGEIKARESIQDIKALFS
ncbi:patatin-like phospholipase family protein [Leptospira sp. GIMC2001]|uniref:patatin-like phospholipase family protein n=1 Tax=Leptospira sp. GIMC2001 TaxID=1513297 RepID=UPI00234AC851|nr:cyclic nucleotide-binding and patatin-like phospholipase domain-containing protein [Leptospira sp. GIMC2001]WCL47889.1 cyclic nucleotide-binding and patatin-like phospholipase domain-containing protein [Leptospira sp. GIMC2001]